jgi:transposase
MVSSGIIISAISQITAIIMPKKLRRPVRNQIELKYCCIDDLLPSDHTARQVWELVEKIDISPLLARVESSEGGVGAPATDPRILLALWLFATIDGVGSAREVDELCRRDLAYQWICGAVSVNYHTLATFRSSVGPFLDDLLTISVAAMVNAGIVNLSCVAVDSMRVRANAGRSSFRRDPTLQELKAAARARVEELKALTTAASSGSRKAQERAARERAERIDAALDAIQQIETARAAEDKAARRKTAKKRAAARASTTDPEARRMAMANGVIAPAYSLQIKTDPETAVVLGVDVTNNGSDRGKLTPAVAEIRKRYGQTPEAILADVGFDGLADIEAVEAEGTAVHVPLSSERNKSKPRKKEGPGVQKCRQRMASEEGKKKYAKRINTEHAHAQMRNHGLHQMPVRGLEKVKAVALLFAFVSNFILFGSKLLNVL